MRKRFAKKLLVSLFFAAFCADASTVQAQEDIFTPPAGTEDGGDPTIGNDPDQTQAPLDGGLLLLLAAGAGYGIKVHGKAIRRKKEGNRDSDS